MQKQAKSKPIHTAQKKQTSDDELLTFTFSKQNYRLLIIGIVLIALGFIFMIGGGSNDPNIFNYKIFNFQRLTLAPILILAGFIVEIFAIMKRSK